jgi:hypothetical protein
MFGWRELKACCSVPWPKPFLHQQLGKCVAFPARLRYPVAMDINKPSNVTSIKQAERRRAKAHRKGLIRRFLPYLVILTVTGIGGVLSLRSMPVGISMPTANTDHRP